jgi:hypothetical protein
VKWVVFNNKDLEDNALDSKNNNIIYDKIKSQLTSEKIVKKMGKFFGKTYKENINVLLQEEKGKKVINNLVIY